MLVYYLCIELYTYILYTHYIHWLAIWLKYRIKYLTFYIFNDLITLWVCTHANGLDLWAVDDGFRMIRWGLFFLHKSRSTSMWAPQRGAHRKLHARLAQWFIYILYISHGLLVFARLVQWFIYIIYQSWSSCFLAFLHFEMCFITDMICDSVLLDVSHIYINPNWSCWVLIMDGQWAATTDLQCYLLICSFRKLRWTKIVIPVPVPVPLFEILNFEYGFSCFISCLKVLKIAETWESLKKTFLGRIHKQGRVNCSLQSWLSFRGGSWRQKQHWDKRIAKMPHCSSNLRNMRQGGWNMIPKWNPWKRRGRDNLHLYKWVCWQFIPLFFLARINVHLAFAEMNI